MKNIEVMIVEDDPMMAFLHKEFVKKEGISDAPLSFKNGKEALDHMISDSDNNSYLVMLDLNMPVMNGWEFLDKLQNTKLIPRTKVVIVTSSVDREEREKAKDYEVVEYYLTKPLLDYTPIHETMEGLKEKV